MGAKKPVNVTLDADLVARARALDISIPQAVEAGLRQTVREAEARRWKDSNRAAIESFRRYIEENGVFGEEWRSW